jgi:uncharacterized membrane protein YhaH (DUF805 family)
MGFGGAIKHNFRHYADFKGRAQRSQFWWWYLFLIVVQVVVSIIDSALGLQIGRSTTDVTVGDTTIPLVDRGLGALQALLFLALVLPTLAVAVRRLHDTEHSGWWILSAVLLEVLGIVATIIAVAAGAGVAVLAILGIVFIGMAVLLVILLVFWVQKGTDGPNQYGPDPLGGSAA